MADLYYEDVDLGDELGPLERHPTLDTVRTFCELWGNSDQTGS